MAHLDLSTLDLSVIHGIGDPVLLFFRNIRMKGYVVGIRFLNDKVKYDVELTFTSVNWENPVKTRIYNVDSRYVSGDPNDLMTHEGLEKAMHDMETAIDAVGKSPEAIDNLRLMYKYLKSELIA